MKYAFKTDRVSLVDAIDVLRIWREPCDFDAGGVDSCSTYISGCLSWPTFHGSHPNDVTVHLENGTKVGFVHFCIGTAHLVFYKTLNEMTYVQLWDGKRISTSIAL